MVVNVVTCVSILPKFIISTVTGETFEINHRFDCNGKCLVFLMTYYKCKKQCTGQTTGGFRSGWNNCKSKCISLEEEKSVCTNVCTFILKVNIIQVSVTMFL